ncbi:hypothetical protein EXS72_03000 [Candidatus Pacearchaeota archaeon]|nr:hypothetical protein [Candidatus Pacearchaeota archaeon]
MDAYTILSEKIAKYSGLPVSEIDKKVDAKKAKLSGLISREGAAQIIAAELGISFENERSKVNELSAGMRRASVVGKITRIFPVKEYNKNGKSGKVASLMLGDETSNIRVTLWDANHISLIEKNELVEGNVIEIRGASVKNGELSLSSFSDIKMSSEKLDSVKERAVVVAGNFKDAVEGASMSSRAFIVQTFEPRYFESKKREGEKGVLLNIVLDDGTATMRSVLFGENIKKLLNVSQEELFSLDVLNAKRAELVGEERIFSGLFRMNSFSNSLEFSAQGIDNIVVDNLIKEFEAKV